MVSGDDGTAKTGIVHGDDVHEFVFAVLNIEKQEQTTHLGHGFDDQNARHDWLAGEMALKKVFVDRDVFNSDDALLSFHFFDSIHEEKWVAVREDFLDPDAVEDHDLAPEWNTSIASAGAQRRCWRRV